MRLRGTLPLLMVLWWSCDGQLVTPGSPRGRGKFGVADRLPLGLVAGGIYVSGPQPLRDQAKPIFCEMSSLGVRWVRIEADWWEVPVAERRQLYTRMVDEAHAHGFKVIVLVPGASCSSPADLPRTDRFTQAYVDKLDALARLFEGHEPDAWEIVNEPNMEEDLKPSFTDEPDDQEGCTGFRVHGNSYAWLLYRVAEWKQRRGRRELIIAGAPANTFVEESWWGGFLNAGVWSDPGRPARLFDFFGLHPYHGCKRSGPGLGMAAWKADLLWRLRDLKNRLDEKLGRSDARFMVTEFGWQTQPCEGDRCFDTPEQAAEAMQTSVEAFADSGLIEAALWYTYRDDSLERFGLRREWDAGLNRYPVKAALWQRFATLAGGPGGEPEACWSPGGPTAPPTDQPPPGVGRWPDGRLQPEIAACHHDHGGTGLMGSPFDNGGGPHVHGWGAGLVQDFIGGGHGPALCMLRTPNSQAFVVRGGIRDAYLAGGGAGALGYPRGDEYESEATGPYQAFERGHITWDHGAQRFRVFY